MLLSESIEAIQQERNRMFQYQPLSQHAREIRVLRLEPESHGSDNKEVIECSIEVVSLEHEPEYTALSYAWGDQSMALPISVNGQTIEITENLHAALLELRNSSPGIPLWIDAICINQQDSIEKSWQVGLMLLIYQQATRVLVWLGPSADDSDTIMASCQDFGSDALATGLQNLDGKELVVAAEAVYNAVSAFNRFKNPEGRPGTFEDMLFRRFYGENRCSFKDLFPPRPVEAFLSRAWWKRIWVLQEFSVARCVSFICGNKVIAADVLECALILLQMYNDAVLAMDSALFTMERVHEGRFEGLENYVNETKSMWTPRYNTENHFWLMFQQRRLYRKMRTVSLYDLIEFASGALTNAPLQASDPRDIVFALLGLSSDASELGIKADYTKSVRKVYEETAIALIKAGWHVFLSAGDVDLEAVKRQAWASWVPDWRRRFSDNGRKHRGAVHDNTVGFAAGHGLSNTKRSLYLLEKPPLLEMTCSILDVVAAVKTLPLSRVENRSREAMLPLHDVSPAFISSVQEANLFAKDQRHPLGYSVNDADVVWRTLMADLVILTVTSRTIAHRISKKSRRKYRDAFNAIVEHRLQAYVTKDHITAFQQIMQDDKDGKIHKRGLENPISPPLPAARTLLEFAFTVRSMLAGRALFKTRQGLFCLGPTETKPGDIIVIPHGTPTPLAFCTLQHHLGNELYGAFKGDVYVHSVMDGEAKSLNLSQRIVNLI